MNEHDDVVCQMRESFAAVRMHVPVEEVFAASRMRRRRRRRLSGLAAAAAATAVVATASMLALGTPAAAPARSSGAPPTASAGTAVLAAFSVASGPGASTTLTLYKGPQYRRLDPDALRQALAQHGIPALVTVGTFCRTTPDAPGFDEVVHPSAALDGSDAMVIDGSAMPPGTQLSIGYFPGRTRMALIAAGAPLSCSSTSAQPDEHIIPSGGSNPVVK